MTLGFIQWLEFLLLPPGLIIPFATFGLIIYKRHKKAGLVLMISGVAITLILAMPKVARHMIANLQVHQPIDVTRKDLVPDTTVLVVLGGGRYPNAPEYQYQDQVSTSTLERLRYAARLKNQLDLPMVLSGGRRNEDSTPEAVMMNKVLVDEYAVEPEFLEVRAANTREQALEVKKILAEMEITKVVIVTHAWHMNRALSEFKAEGLETVPAPMGFMATATHTIDYLPSAAAMNISARALHEHYAQIWLSLRYSSPQKPSTKLTEPDQNQPESDENTAQ